MCTGSFRPTTGTRHLHRDYSFTGSLVETAPKSLRHSCRSELTRQGISLWSYSDTSERNSTSFDAVPCMSPCRGDHLFIRPADVRRMASEDSHIDCGPFVLIVRTRRIFTAGRRPTSSAGYSEFPAYSRMRTTPLPARGAANLP